MKGGSYQGGSTLIGKGVVAKVKRRGGGLGTSRAALVEKERAAQLERKKEAAKLVKATEKVVRKLSQEWHAEKGKKHYQRLVLEERAQVSPLAAALKTAMERSKA
jgi:hypothetical protein